LSPYGGYDTNLPIKVDTTDPEDSMGHLAVLLLAMFAQMERTYSAERAAHARAVVTAQGRRTGRPITVDAAELERALWMRDHGGCSMSAIVKKTKIPRSSLYRHLPPRAPEPITAAGGDGAPEDRSALMRTVGAQIGGEQRELRERPRTVRETES